MTPGFPKASGAGERTLDGVRVLDLGRYIAAPLCAALLGDLGAEVIRVEGVEGASDRQVMPVGEGVDGALYRQVNRNKRSLTLNFETAKGRAVLHDLLRGSDVVVVNLPPAALRKLGLDYASLSAVNPGIVLTTVTAYGYAGAERDSIGFDGTGQALSGAMYLTGNGETPFRAAVSYVDYSTGLAAAYATLAALLTKFRTGRGQQVETSLLGTALTIMNPLLIEEAAGARSRRPSGNRSPIAGPSDLFATRDGWILVQVIGDAMFARWAALVGRADLVGDPRFADDIRRGENGAMLSACMADWCAPRGTADCLEALRQARVPGCPVLTPAEALRAPAVAGGGFFTWLRDAELGRNLPIAGPVVRLSGTETAAVGGAPALGQDTDSILASLGYEPGAIGQLRDEGII